MRKNNIERLAQRETGRNLRDDSSRLTKLETAEYPYVGLSGNETVAGNKTFSSILTATIRSYTAGVNDDAVLTVPLLRTRGFAAVITGSSNGELVIVAYRAEATPFIISISTGSQAEVFTATGALTGTTGTDGRIIVSVDSSGNFYIENRRGGARTVHVSFF